MRLRRLQLAGLSGGLISFPVRVANSTYCVVLSILDLSTRTVINCGVLNPIPTASLSFLVCPAL